MRTEKNRTDNVREGRRGKEREGVGRRGRRAKEREWEGNSREGEEKVRCSAASATVKLAQTYIR